MSKVDWVEEGLVEWGKWQRSVSGGSSMYPTASIEERLRNNNGFVGDGCRGGSSVRPEPDMTAKVEFFEMIIGRLPVDFKEAVKIKYYWMPDSSGEDQAARLSGELKRLVSRRRMSEMIYYSHLVISGAYIGVDL